MKTWTTLAWLLSAALLGGCGDRGMEREEAGHEEEREAAGPGHENGHAGEEPEAGGEEVLTLSPEALRDLRLTTFPAELRAGGQGIAVPGELRVDEQAYAEVATPIPARVTGLLASPGETVRRGQALASLQSVELGQARADHAAARARLELARKTVERKRGLAEERIVSRGELQRAEAEAAEAEAELQAAEAALGALGLGSGAPGDLSRFSLRSPIAGTVLERRAVRGQMADPSQPLFRVADLSRLWLVVQAPERDAVRMRPGASAAVALAALPGQTLAAEVSWVGREVDPHSRTVPVRIVLPNPDGALKPGMFATAVIASAAAGAEERVVAVPSAALQRLDDRWVVFLPRGTGRFEVRPVERGRDLGGEVAVLSGLEPGEEVVVEGAFLLRAEAEKQEGGGEEHHHH